MPAKSLLGVSFLKSLQSKPTRKKGCDVLLSQGGENYTQICSQETFARLMKKSKNGTTVHSLNRQISSESIKIKSV